MSKVEKSSIDDQAKEQVANIPIFEIERHNIKPIKENSPEKEPVIKENEPVARKEKKKKEATEVRRK